MVVVAGLIVAPARLISALLFSLAPGRGTAEPQRENVAWLEVKLGLRSDDINGIAVGPSAGVWISTNVGLSKLVDGRFRNLTRGSLLPNSQTLAISSVARGILVATANGLLWLDDLQSVEELAPALFGKADRVVSIIPRPTGETWVAYQEASLTRIVRLRFDARGAPRVEEPVTSFDDRLREVLPGPGGRLLCHRSSRYWYLCDPATGSIEAKPFEKDTASVQSLIVGDGLLVLTPEKVLYWPSGQGGAEPRVIEGLGEGVGCLAPSRAGARVWVGRKGTLYLFDVRTQTEVRRLELPAELTPSRVLEDFSGFLWVVSRGKGVFVTLPSSAGGARVLKQLIESSREQPAPKNREDEGTVDDFDEEADTSIDYRHLPEGRLLARRSDTCVIFDPRSETGESCPAPIDSVLAGEAVAVRVGDRISILEGNGLTPVATVARPRHKERPRKLPVGIHGGQPERLRIRAARRYSGPDRLEDSPLAPYSLEPLGSVIDRDSGELLLAARGHEVASLGESGDVVIRAPVTETSTCHIIHKVPLLGTVRSAVSEPSRKAVLVTDDTGPFMITDHLALQRLGWGNFSSWIRPGSETPSAHSWLLRQGSILALDPGDRFVAAQLPVTGGVPIGGLIVPPSGEIWALTALDDVIRIRDRNVISESRSAGNTLIGAGPRLAYDPSRDAIALLTARGVRFVSKGTERFLGFPTIVEHTRQLLIGRNGEIFFGASIRGAYRLSARGKLTSLSHDEAWTMALFPTREGGTENLWLGSFAPLLLRALDPATGKVTGDFAALLGGVLEGSVSDIAFAATIDGLFVMTTAGLARVRLEKGGVAIERVELPGFPLTQEADVRLYGTSVVATPSGQVVAWRYWEGRSLVWRRRSTSDLFARPLELPFVVTAAAITAQGDLVIGTEDGDVMRIEDDRIERLRVAHSTFQFRAQSVTSAALFANDDLLLANPAARRLRFHDGVWDSVSSSSVLYPWKSSAQLGKERLLLVHERGSVSIISAAELEPRTITGYQGSPLALASLEDPGSAEPKIFLLTTTGVSAFDRAREQFEPPYIELPPPAVFGAIQSDTFIAGKTGLWVGSAGNGLWFHPLAAEGTWRNYTERDGLPSSTIQAIAARDADRFLVFTAGGWVTAAHLGAEWSFASDPPAHGIAADEVRDAALFELAGGRAIAVASDRGVTIARWLPGQSLGPEPSSWLRLDGETGLLDSDARMLVADEAHSRLWIATSNGITAAELRLVRTAALGDEVGSLEVRHTWSLGIAEAFDTSHIDIWSMRISPDGDRVLLDTSLGLWLWEIHRRKAWPIAPFLFGGGRNLNLGFWNKERPPELVVTKNRQASIWPLPERIRLTMHIENLAGIISLAHPELEGIDSSFLDESELKIEYSIDGDPDSWSTGGWWLPLDLWRENGGHAVVARATLDADPTREVRAFAAMPEIDSAWLRYLRLGALLTVLATPAVFAARAGGRRTQRARLYRVKHIPYIVGEAIQRADQFFGRQPLLDEVRNSIATKSWALVGYYRIGKTSVQYRLRDILAKAEDPRHKYFSVFIDMQRSPALDAELFFFFAQSIAADAERLDISADTLQALRWKEGAAPGSYRLIDFEADLRTLLDHWAAACAPRSPIFVLQIDEVSLFDKYTYDTLLLFRSLFVSEPRLKTILTGTEIPKKQRIAPSQWWNFFSERVVEPLTPDEARELITRPVRKLKLFDFENQAIEEVMIEARREPHRIQTLCAELLAYAYEQKPFRTRLTHADVRRFLEVRQTRNKRTVFRVGIAASGTSFYGRASELAQIFEHRMVCLCGQRRMGKTSLLRKVELEAQRRGWRAFYFDVVRVGNIHSPARLLESFFEEHAAALRSPGIGIEPATLLADPDPARAFGKLARAMAAGGQPVIFLWDEAERLIDIESSRPGFLDELMSSLSAIPELRFVLATSQTLVNVRKPNHGAAFLSSFKWVHMGGLADSDARALLTCEQTGGWNSPLADKIIAQILTWCGGHPYMLQEIGDRLANEQSVSGEGSFVDDAVVQAAKLHLTRAPHIREILADDQQRLTPSQLALLRTVAQSLEPMDIATAGLTIGMPQHIVESAAADLASYGYLIWDERLRLRFMFYLSFLGDAPEAATLTNEDLRSRIEPILFISYAHEDKDTLDQLMVFLRPLLRGHLAKTVFSDRTLEAGDRWDPKIRDALARARIAVLLITQHFLDSEYITSVEMPVLLNLALEKRLDLLCLYVAPSNVTAVEYDLEGEKIRLTEFQGLNAADAPLTAQSEADRLSLLSQVSTVIRNRLSGLA